MDRRNRTDRGTYDGTPGEAGSRASGAARDGPDSRRRAASGRAASGRTDARGVATRRTLLRALAPAFAAALAGCGAWGDPEAGPGGATDSPEPTGSSTPDPDAGNDSYGVEVVNETDSEVSVKVQAGPLWEQEDLLSETLTIGGEDTREWSQVLTDSETEYEVSGVLPNYDWRMSSDGMSFETGADDAPPTPNVIVRLWAPEFNEEEAGEGRTYAVDVRWPDEYMPTPREG